MGGLKVCLACSAGGHLTELLQIREAWEGYETFLITFRREDTRNFQGERIYYVTDPKRNPLLLLRNLLEVFRILRKERPHVILTTGAGVVVPLCYLGKLLGAKVIYIESLARIDSRSLTGVFLYPISDLFFVQWRDLLGQYGGKAVYGGTVV
jgi:UDP-N-acetylglucosamine:LPS N-acetylglucosamine transferase